MKFCTSCGARSEVGEWCTNCGHRRDTVEAEQKSSKRVDSPVSAIGSVVAGAVWAAVGALTAAKLTSLHPDNWTFGFGYGATFIAGIQIIAGLRLLVDRSRRTPWVLRIGKTRRTALVMLIAMPLLGQWSEQGGETDRDPTAKQAANASYSGVTLTGGTLLATKELLDQYTFELICGNDVVSRATPVGDHRNGATKLLVDPVALAGCSDMELFDGFETLPVVVTNKLEGLINTQYNLDAFKVAAAKEDEIYFVFSSTERGGRVARIKLKKVGSQWRQAGPTVKYEGTNNGSPVVDSNGRVVGILDNAGAFVPVVSKR